MWDYNKSSCESFVLKEEGKECVSEKILKQTKKITENFTHYERRGQEHTESSQTNPNRIMPNKSIAKKALNGQMS